MRHHPRDMRCAFCPSDASSSKSSAKRWYWSIASPDTSTAGVPGACSQAHQSLAALPPSTWWAAVEDPKRKPSGKSASGDAGPLALAEAGGRAQRVGLVRPLPREVVVLAAEVAIG